MRKHIKNTTKIVYRDNPDLGELIVVKDTLPSPEAFRRARLQKEHISVTLSLPKDVIAVVKKEAEKKKLHYKALLQSLIAGYTRQRIHTSS